MKESGPIHRRVLQYAAEDVDTLYSELNITSDGYSDEQADESRSRFGGNLIAKRAKDTVLYRLRRAFINPFTIILFILAAISFITDVLLASNFSRDATTVIIIVAMILISGIIRFIQELKAKKIAEHLTDLLHSSVSVLRNGAWCELSSSELVVGDTVRLAAGDRVPADIRLTKTSDLFVSQSMITGESDIFEKDTSRISPSSRMAYGDYKNIIFMGSAVTGGSCTGIVAAVGKDTVYGGFSGGISEKSDRFNKGANSIAWVLIRFMVVLIPIVFIACGITKGNWLYAFLFALSVAVGLTPEMLPMVVTACLSKGSASMGKKQTVVKNIEAMQGFGSMDVLCVDKTGTLTGDKLILEYYMDILGNESMHVLELAYMNSLYHTGVPNHIDSAILERTGLPESLPRLSAAASDYPKLDELPFDYGRKLSSVLVKDRDGSLIIVKGNIDDVARRCTHIEYKDERIPIEGDIYSNVHAIVDDILDDGMKVLAVAYKHTDKELLTPDDENGLTLAGYLAFFDAPKDTAAASIQRLRELNVDIKVLTGDNERTAVSVCRRLGIDTSATLTGAALNSMTDDEQLSRIESSCIFTDLSPKQKAEIVRTLQVNGHTVGFLGDGMNDLSAIVDSDVGISVDTAAEAVTECADVILLKKDLNVLGQGILEGRKAFYNMSKYIRITASSNFGNILSIVIASVFLPIFPMTSIQLLLLNLLYDALCLVLPWDNVDDESCVRPLEWSGSTLGRFMRFFGPVSSIFDIITFAFLFFIFCPAVCGEGFFAISSANVRAEFTALFQTGWFLESMWTQILILHLLRTPKLPILHSRPSVPVMIVTALGIIFFTIMTFTPIAPLIGLTAMPAAYFAFLVVIVILYLMFMSLRKKRYISKYHELI